MPQETLSCDDLIIGAGTAGAVLAARLSEDGRRSVVLVEAGPDMPPDNVPEDVRDLFPMSTFNPAYCWPDLKVHWRGRDTSPASPFQQGRIIGGGSTIMGMWALRGVPEDYDDWAAAGADGWSWNDVLPWFKRLETDHDFDGPMHGQDGPIPIRRQPREEWSPLAKAVGAMPGQTVFDMNADFSDGHCVLPISRFEDSRASAGICYLDETVRQRRNLTIITDTTAEKLVFAEDRVVGAIVRGSSGRIRIESSQTIICAGAIYSPLLLMRSGIGPGDVLKAAGMEVRHHLAGVGENLQNHPLLLAFAWLEPRARDAGLGRPPASTYLRWSSGEPGTHRGDMGMYVRSYVAWHALGRQLAMVGPVLMRPRSRGTVRLTGPDAATQPSVAFNFLSDPLDETRLCDGLRRAAGILAAPELKGVTGEPFAIMNPGRLGRYNAVSTKNAILARCAATARNIAPGLTQRAFERWADFRPLDSVMASDNSIVDMARDQTIGTNHVCGTARMGHRSDLLAVTGPNGDVHGLTGLKVADASIMPNVTSGNTHIPVVMLAEKIAAGMMREAASHG